MYFYPIRKYEIQKLVAAPKEYEDVFFTGAGQVLLFLKRLLKVKNPNCRSSGFEKFNYSVKKLYASTF